MQAACRSAERRPPAMDGRSNFPDAGSPHGTPPRAQCFHRPVIPRCPPPAHPSEDTPMNRIFPALLATALAATLTPNAQAAAPAAASEDSAIRNIVLVHGAFADGSGWRGVYDVLSGRGYRVTIVQNPLTSLADDVAATRRALDRQDGPAILVGHYWAER